MGKLMCLMGALLLPALADAAEDAPKADLYLGFSVVRAPLGANLPNPVQTGSFPLYGGGAGIAYNLTKMIGIVADVGVYNVSGGIGGSGNLSTYLFGPRLSYRGNRRFRPYFHVLAGGAHTDAQVFQAPQAQNSLAVLAGAGVDIKLFDHLALRMGQADVFHTSFRVGTATAANGHNNLRVSTGIVFSFGK